ncbi:hypothetical protein Aduo_006945 [Ancylostoma duodenale]
MSPKEKYLVYLCAVTFMSFISLITLVGPLTTSEPRWTPLKMKSPASRQQRNLIHTRQKNSEECAHTYGRVMILVMYSGDGKNFHGTAQKTLECYAKIKKYELVQVDIDINERIRNACSKHKVVKFRKYCAAAEFLKDTDWMLVIDDNTAVANPDHCIEEWIDDRVHLVLYDQTNNWDISSESYLIRKSQWSMQFLQELAEKEFQLKFDWWNKHGEESMAVRLIHELSSDGTRDYKQCLKQWRSATTYDVSSVCARAVLGFQRLWPGKVRIYRKAHAWAREAFLTGNFWCDSDFMLHDWQEESLEKKSYISPNHDEIDPAVCARRENGWNWLPNKYTNVSRVKHLKYPSRNNMGECPPLLGKVTVFVTYTAPVRQNFYDVAQRTLMCYLKTTNYTLLLIDLDKDQRVRSGCSNHSNLFYRKHCAVAMYLPDTDWMLVLDADTGVVNPNHCIEEWIDDRVDVLLYERFFNWEVAAGNYLVKNSEFGRKFLHEFANHEFKSPNSWHGNDQGGLMMLLLKLLLPDATGEYSTCEDYWKSARDYNTYMALVICVREALGAERIWPKKVRLFHKAEAFVRDALLTNQE